MIRILGLTIAIMSTSLVLTAAAVIGYFGSMGTLTKSNLTEILSILKNDPTLIQQGVPEVDTTPLITNDQLVAERTKVILSLTERERELELIKKAITEQSDLVLKERTALESTRSAFLKQLKTIEEETMSAAADQSRGILLKMKPEVAVTNLMAMTPNEAIMILQGMGEKDSAKLLQTFQTGNAEQRDRASQIFLAISRGQPKADLAQQTQKDIRPAAEPTDNMR